MFAPHAFAPRAGVHVTNRNVEDCLRMWPPNQLHEAKYVAALQEEEAIAYLCAPTRSGIRHVSYDDRHAAGKPFMARIDPCRNSEKNTRNACKLVGPMRATQEETARDVVYMLKRVAAGADGLRAVE